MKRLAAPRRRFWLAPSAALLLLGVLSAVCAAATSPAAPPAPSTAPVYWLSITGAVDPAVSRYVGEGLAEAEADGAQLAVIALDGSGGSLDAAREVVQSILNARVPVAVFVEPRGARATGASLFILMAADVAAMAPETYLGAARIPAAGGKPAGAAWEAKAVPDAAGYARSLARDKGRNAEWAEQAVLDNASLASDEAASEKVIDVVADDEDDLAAKLQGGSIVKDGETFVFDPDGAPGVDWEMSPSEKALHMLGSPAWAEGLFASPLLGAGGVAAALLFILLALGSAWKLRRVRPLTGREALAGRIAVVRSGGQVFLDGQLWTADGYGPFEPGEKVRVTGVEGNVLKIEKL